MYTGYTYGYALLEIAKIVVPPTLGAFAAAFATLRLARGLRARRAPRAEVSRWRPA